MKLIINFIVFSSFSLIMLSCKDSSILMRNEEFNQVWTVESIQSDFENSTFPISILNLKNTEISKISSRTEPKKFSGFINTKARSTAGFWYHLSDNTVEIEGVYDYDLVSSGSSGSFSSKLSPPLNYFNSVLNGKWKFEIIENRMVWTNLENSSKILFKLSQ